MAKRSASEKTRDHDNQPREAQPRDDAFHDNQPHDDHLQLEKTDIIFCGNPGVGKSSIATSISGVQFESGISFGSGLTMKLKWNESPTLPGIRFADTPGLADMELKEQTLCRVVRPN